MTTKANSIAIPVGFNPRNPASVAAAVALLPDDGLDTYSLAQQSGVKLVSPAQQIDLLSVTTGTFVDVVDFNYALTLPAESFSLATGGMVEYQDVLIVPAAGVTVAGLAPSVATGAAVQVPPAGVLVDGLAPAVQPSTRVEVPAAIPVVVAAVAPSQVGRQRLEVLVPTAANVTVEGVAPEVLAVTVIEVPAAVIVIAGRAPRIGGPDYWSSWAQQNYGWWPESYPDWWAN